jgi:hypothetical protein
VYNETRSRILKDKKLYSGERVCLMKSSRDLQMTCAAVTHLDIVLSLEALLILKVEKSLICLMGTSRAAVSIIEQRLILFLKELTRSKEFCAVVWNKVL